jgi:hypothetical protein
MSLESGQADIPKHHPEVSSDFQSPEYENTDVMWCAL